MLFVQSRANNILNCFVLKQCTANQFRTMTVALKNMIHRLLCSILLPYMQTCLLMEKKLSKKNYVESTIRHLHRHFHFYCSAAKKLHVYRQFSEMLIPLLHPEITHKTILIDFSSMHQKLISCEFFLSDFNYLKSII